MAETPQTQIPFTDFTLAYTPGFGNLTDKRIEEIRSQLIESDGEPMETQWHVVQMNLLIDCTEYRFRDRDDFFVGGNMFVYYSMAQLKRNEFRGPDYFFVWGTDLHRKRKYWWVVDENGKLPDVIIELLSETTAKYDLTGKKDIYEQVFKTAEYFCFNPDTKELLGWRLKGGKYHPIEPDENGRLKSEQLGLWLGVQQGDYRICFDYVWLRFFDENGKLVPTSTEAAQQLADTARQLAEKKQDELKKSKVKLKQSREKLKQKEHELQKQQSERVEMEKQLAVMKKLLDEKGLTPPDK